MRVKKKPNSQDGRHWAYFRHAVIGPLLASPPATGDLRCALKDLACRVWTHPVTGENVSFSFSTLERWYYKAVSNLQNPVDGLGRKRRVDAGRPRAMTVELRQALATQYSAHKSWTVERHYKNLIALAVTNPELGKVPCYKTVSRYMKKQGLEKRRRITRRDTAGALAADARLETREVRSYEVEFANALWHWDYHHGKLPVMTKRRGLLTPLLLAVVDDHSRLGCHAQWYLAETAENVAHSLMQAMQKRGLPRSAMCDNGAPMIAAEIAKGFADLSIVHEKTLPYSPYQNGKIERLWQRIDGQLLPELENVRDLTLAQLNEATQAWIEDDYNCGFHDAINATPIDRFLAAIKTEGGSQVIRDCPDTAELRFAFMRVENRKQNKNDGTIGIRKVRFEVPNRYRHMTDITVRYASWDLSSVYMIDDQTGSALTRLFPVDLAANADGMRRSLTPISNQPCAGPPAEAAPHITLLLKKRFAMGLPAPYIVKDEDE